MLLEDEYDHVVLQLLVRTAVARHSYDNRSRCKTSSTTFLVFQCNCVGVFKLHELMILELDGWRKADMTCSSSLNRPNLCTSGNVGMLQ